MNFQKSIVAVALIFSLLTGCTGAHFDITREIGLLPPRIEERSDFSKAARDTCDAYHKNVDHDACTEYWEVALWAQDYRSYVRARAIWNRDVIYLSGVAALASVGALAGFSALGHTSSDAYKIIPLVGAFASGLLAFSKNDVLYEAYEVAGMKIDQALRSAEDKLVPGTPTAYREAASTLRRDVGSAIDQLTQKKIEIVKFQSKSESEQFKEVHGAAAERDLAHLRLINAQAQPALPADPSKIVAKLNSALDPQKVPAEELRLHLTDMATNKTFSLRVSAVNGAELSAELPRELLYHGPHTYRVEVQARNGEYTVRDSFAVPLKFTKVRLDIKVSGNGAVSYQDAMGKPVNCAPDCDTGLLSTTNTTRLTATPGTPGSNLYSWNSTMVSCAANSPCTIANPQDDIKMEVTFP